MEDSSVSRTAVIIDTKEAIQNPEIEFTDPPVYIDSNDRVVGNGTYWSTAILFGAGLTYRWGKNANLTPKK